jgi:hypothetical protein
VFPAANLHVDVLVVVLVQGGGRAVIAEPEVDRVGRLLEGFSCEGNSWRDIGEEGRVFGAEVVILFEMCVAALVVFVSFHLDRNR